jgi:hypothetical protein
MKPVIGQFMHYPEVNQTAANNSQGQTGNIDKRKSLVPPNVSKCNFKIIK